MQEGFLSFLRISSWPTALPEAMFGQRVFQLWFLNLAGEDFACRLRPALYSTCYVYFISLCMLPNMYVPPLMYNKRVLYVLIRYVFRLRVHLANAMSRDSSV